MYINCKGHLIDLSTPKVMGILNITPDSFYDGGQRQNLEEHLQQADKMLQEGADFIDIGAYSSRPGATDISEAEELQRILPVVEVLIKKFPNIIISVDTFRSEVARPCVEAGAAMINDISAGNLDDKMMATVAKLQVPYIMMHMRGNPQTMKDLNQYEDLTKDILFYFSEKIDRARELGINDLIIDPGFGFSKNISQNFELLSHLELFKNLDLPILSGLSRKSLIYKTFHTTPEEALNGTTVLNTVSLLKGANILRVHDVKEAVECVKLLQQLKN
ncbi:dihydropteroate synthase [Salinimicrobium sediminilitoris]|uniref:dihydropteroate synthase n=1 Tax=Salinimicrobium sediminilitoris TaxID=2876715 RepID=UPI001E478A84|nr:dihydropteroate synthase [Salinimicrobium sediminilitoris]MCC8360768.1 dihydropteroate synthase [Salinimicrobium sediminilitoris]